MALKFLKNVALSLLMIGCTALTSCQKNDDLKKQLAELTARVNNIESQLTQINKDLTILQQQGKLNAEEITVLKGLTASLSTLTNDIKNNTSLNSKEIEDLKVLIQQAATTVQVNDLKQTINQLNALVASNYLEQQLSAQNTAKLNAIIDQFAADVEKLKSGYQDGPLDRPINLKASKGSFGNRIIVSWTPMPTAKNYQLFKFNYNTGIYDMITQGADTTFTDLSTFEAYKKSFYKVKIVNSSTEFSPYSDVDYGYTSGRNFSKYFSFGSEGYGFGQFQFANHVEVDASDNIYVSDEGSINNRVQKFDKLGKFQEIFFTGNAARGIAFLKNGNAVVTRVQSSSYIKILDAQKNVVREWGTYGNSDTAFGNIEEITVDEQDNIYVVDGTNNYIKKFDKNGNFLLKFQAAARASGQLDQAYPYGICYYNEKIFVTSPRNGQIRIFDKQGNYLKTWDTGGRTCLAIKAFKTHLYIACDTYVMKTDEAGEIREKIGEGQFYNQITGLAVNSDEEIIVSDVYARSIIVFKKL